MTYIWIALLIYLLFLSLLFVFQRSYIYYPDMTKPDRKAAGVPDMEIITVITEDGLALEGWYKPPADREKPVIVLFHGNGGHIGWRGFKARLFMDRGYGFLLAEYRGYAGNPGKPAEKGLYRDGRAYMKWLAAQGFKPDDIVLLGESLGTAVAIKMAEEFSPVRALILETPFTSLANLSQHHIYYAPAYFLIRDRYNSVSRIGKLHVPILVIHGTADTIVPYSFAQKLFEAASEPKKMETLSMGGHNNLYAFGAADKIISFLDGHLRPVQTLNPGSGDHGL